MKISIGTANFGNFYGINKNKIFHKDELNEIIKYCQKNNIDTIDNAQSYNKSQNLISNFEVTKFNFITKIKLGNVKKKNISKELIIKDLKKTKKNLKIKKFYGVLSHEFYKSKKKNLEMVSILKELKKKGITKKIGISVYDPKEVEKILKYWKPDIVQCPLNALDQRFYRTGCIKKLHNLKTEVHVRSIFLQGLLLKDYKDIPKKFNKWSTDLKKWINFCLKNRVSQFTVCINFVKSIKNISYVVVGFDNFEQIKEITAKFKKKNNNTNLFEGYSTSKQLIEPRLW